MLKSLRLNREISLQKLTKFFFVVAVILAGLAIVSGIVAPGLVRWFAPAAAIVGFIALRMYGSPDA